MLLVRWLEEAFTGPPRTQSAELLAALGPQLPADLFDAAIGRARLDARHSLYFLVTLAVVARRRSAT